MSSNVLLWQRRLTAYWVTLAILLLVGSGGDLFLGRHISTARPSSRLSNTTEIWVLLCKATKLSRGWSICWYKEMPKVLGLFKLEKGRKTEGNILLFITDKEHGDILLSVVFSKRRRDNGQKLKYKKFHLNIRKKKHFVSESAQQVTQKVCAVSVCGGIQDPTAKVIGNLL